MGLQSSPALDVAVPALLLVRLGHAGRAADAVGQLGPEVLRFAQLPYDLHHLQQEPKRQKEHLSGFKRTRLKKKKKKIKSSRRQCATD